MAIYDYSSGGFPASPATDDTLAMNGTTYKYNGSAWEVQTGGTTSYVYTATSGQTAFTGSDSNSKTLAYTAASIHVFLNGVLLDAADYTATDGTTVTLGTGASTGDTLQIVAYGVLVSSGGGGGGGAWTEIATQTVSSSAASVTFASLDLSSYRVVRLEMYDIFKNNNYRTELKTSSDGFTTEDDWPLNGTAWFDNTKTGYGYDSNASRAGGGGTYFPVVPWNIWNMTAKGMSGYIDFTVNESEILVNGSGVAYEDGSAAVLWTGMIDATTFTDLKLENYSGNFTAGTFTLIGMG